MRRLQSESKRLVRRGFLPRLVTPLIIPMAGWLASPASADEPTQPLNRFPRMVHEYFVRQVREAQRRGVVAQERMANAVDARRYVSGVRRKIRDSFGPEPERTPLNARITGVIEREGYRIEKLIFDSRPNFPVTANVYVPLYPQRPVPGVVGTCGHSTNGKAAESYQAFAQGLAKLGYICLIYDPIGQGERSQYVDDDLKSKLHLGTRQHLHAGNQQFLVGEFFGAWRAWDGVRALDYLLTRDDVDKNHLGVTGNSGGGTMTTWLAGVEQRWTMIAPSCFVTTFLHNMENELPADTEQCPPRVLAMGLDHSDFLAASAPDATIVLAKERDFFDVRGSEEAYDRLKRLYQLLGNEDQVSLFTGPTDHGYSQENREAMYRWFNKATGVSDARTEPDINIEDEDTLWCTANGQVAELNAKPVFDFTSEAAHALDEKRGDVDGQALKRAVRDVLKLGPRPDLPPHYRVLRDTTRREYPLPFHIHYAVETEKDIFAIVTLLAPERMQSRPPRLGPKATLYVSHRSADAELRDESLIRDTIAADPQIPFFACDVRGIGDSMPGTCGGRSFDSHYGPDYFYAVHSLMLDRPYVGQKTTDVLRVVDWLASSGYTDIHLIATGWGALAGTFASLLDDRITRVTLKNPLTSYSDIARAEHYDWPLATLLPNVLARFDMPDCYRALKKKSLRLIDPWNANAQAPG